MDQMTTTKIVGGLCGSFLIFLLLNWAGESIYRVGPAGHGGEAEHAEAAYAIEVPEAATGGEGTEAGPAYAEFAAAADAAAGEGLFAKCKGCHKIDGSNGTGPALNGVVGRDVGAAGGFAYSDAMLAKEGTWTPEELFAFLGAPKAYVKGTKMNFAGFKKPEDRANIIAYLGSLN
jgi:cytochrome c